MPLYVYEIILEGEEAEEGGMQFEIMQSIHDEPLTEHPITGQPIRRVISEVNVAGKWTDMKSKSTLESDSKLKNSGFGKYEKTDNGTYQKIAGHGPDSLTADEIKKQ